MFHSTAIARTAPLYERVRSVIPAHRMADIR